MNTIKKAFVSAFLAALNDQAAAERAWNKIFWIEEPTTEQAERRGREAAWKAIRVASIVGAAR